MQKVQQLEIPSPSSFLKPIKTGYLRKYSQRTWFLPGSWKRKFCVLDGTKIYFYENEGCKGTERSAGVISLDYYDLCFEGSTKDNKRASNVFIISSSVRGFFDMQHLFSADTLPEMSEWVTLIKEAISEARSKRSRAGRAHGKDKRKKEPMRPRSVDSSPVFKVSTNRPSSHGALELPSGERLYTPTKDRDRGPRGRRLPQRKTMMTRLGEDGDLRIRASSLSALENVDSAKNESWLKYSPNISGPRQTNSGTDLAYQYSSSEDSVTEEDVSTTTTQGFPYSGTASSRSSTLGHTRGSGMQNGNHTKRTASDSTSAAKDPTRFQRRVVPIGFGSENTQMNALMKEMEKKIASMERSSAEVTSSQRNSLKHRISSSDSQRRSRCQVMIETIDDRLSTVQMAVDALEEEVNVARNDVSSVQHHLNTIKSNAEITNERVEKINSHIHLLDDRMISTLKETQALCEKTREVLDDATKAKKQYEELKEECQVLLQELKQHIKHE
ncbi:uncharacterized protein LOC143236054 [Tachypleus tridentatus]|uniref:uncharacterized protein LOC143236054 n=1 Tax=Tachypleus tridentatus TaxID=6853 RepID=UPI003FCF3654